jgi:uncharacterized membrane protein YbaN (DUF454 family)
MHLTAKSVTKPLLVALGLIAFGLGTVGIFLPLLPTTPLYLLAAACFARSSRRFHRWFLGTGLYRNHLAGFVATRSMTMRTKLTICVPVTFMLALACLVAPNWPVRAVIILVAAAKWYYFLVRIKTTTSEAARPPVRPEPVADGSQLTPVAPVGASPPTGDAADLG